MSKFKWFNEPPTEADRADAKASLEVFKGMSVADKQKLPLGSRLQLLALMAMEGNHLALAEGWLIGVAEEVSTAIGKTMVTCSAELAEDYKKTKAQFDALEASLEALGQAGGMQDIMDTLRSQRDAKKGELAKMMVTMIG